MQIACAAKFSLEQSIGTPRNKMSIAFTSDKNDVGLKISIIAFEINGNIGARSCLTEIAIPLKRKFGKIKFSSPVKPFDLSGRKMNVSFNENVD